MKKAKRNSADYMVSGNYVEASGKFHDVELQFFAHALLDSAVRAFGRDGCVKQDAKCKGFLTMETAPSGCLIIEMHGTFSSANLMLHAHSFLSHVLGRTKNPWR